MVFLRSFVLRRHGNGYILAIGAVAVALAVRAGLEGFGSFYYLSMVPAVMATAILAGRRATGLAVVLSIAANVAVVHRDNLLDTATNAVLFAAVSWTVAEVCWQLRAFQRRTAELSHRLARRNTMLATILASFPVVTLDRSGAIRFLTPPACTLLGASPAMAIGQPFGMFVEHFDLDTFSVGRNIDGATADHFWIGRCGDGRKLPLSILLGLMPDEADGDYATLCLTDLTQSHAADARAQELHGQLNRVWRLNSLGEMAASLAHELNQPLSAATTYLHASQMDVRRAGLIGESAARTIELAKAQLLRAGEIIRRMRELLAHGTRSLGIERVAPMVADLSGVFSMIERADGVSIELRIDDLNDRVRVGRIQFQQAMVNLVRNAVEALEGWPDPRVLIIGRVVSDESYELRIEDNGPGIAAAEMDSIFRTLMTTKTGGMGLGLSVTRTIVESHGGVLEVEASDLGGAAFSFCLIRERESELEDA